MTGCFWRVAGTAVQGMCSVWTVDRSRPRGAGARAMSVFSEAELAYLAQGKLGRLATIDAGGMPHVVPLGWRYNPALDTIDIGGRDFALVIDDVLPPWRPRCVLIRGTAQALPDAAGPDGQPAGPIIRLHPAEVISWGMEFAGE